MAKHSRDVEGAAIDGENNPRILRTITVAGLPAPKKRSDITMAQFTTYLSFNGNCAEAMRFYERALNGKLQALLTNDQTPAADQVPPGNGDRIMHSYLVADGFVLMAGDSFVGQPNDGIRGLQLTLTYGTAAQARPIFDALADGGKVTMPFQKTFWAEGAGMVIDKFGTPWIINGGSQADAAGG